MDAVTLDFVRVTDHHHVRDKVILVREVHGRTVRNRSTLLPFQIVPEDAVDVAGNERVICGGGGHHDYLAADQLLRRVVLICQIGVHDSTPFPLVSTVSGYDSIIQDGPEIRKDIFLTRRT